MFEDKCRCPIAAFSAPLCMYIRIKPKKRSFAPPSDICSCMKTSAAPRYLLSRRDSSAKSFTTTIAIQMIGLVMTLLVPRLPGTTRSKDKVRGGTSNIRALSTYRYRVFRLELLRGVVGERWFQPISHLLLLLLAG